MSTGLNQYKYPGNPVLARNPGMWDSVDVGHIAVLIPDETHDGQWHAWYAGHAGREIEIGHATSSDGISWNKDSRNPVLSSPGHSVNDPFVVPVMDSGKLTYHMFVEYFNRETQTYSIGKSLSSDGIDWSEVRKVLKAEPKLADEVGVSVALVHRDEASSKWSMLFSGIDAAHPTWVIWTGLAESADGENWNKVEVLEKRQDKFIFPHAMLKRDVFMALFVTGLDDIHLAGSVDLRQWTILPKVILSQSEPYENPAGETAGIGADGLALAYYKGKYYVYYSYYANTAGNRDIGAAVVDEFPAPTPITYPSGEGQIVPDVPKPHRGILSRLLVVAKEQEPSILTVDRIPWAKR
ncbi:MAG: hypothetical protein QF579_04845 [Dehalococcoidia bacterium]|jgi:predicted GH43/DUF377 family glycosyl hydrolase|nr:hypothetical protein [Dehalococcoidia bacterium]